MKRLIQPIIYNLPLFVITILLLGGFDVCFHQYHFHENNATGLFLAYSEMVMMAYVVCLISYWLRKIHLKVLFYVILFTIYAVNCYLRLAFSTDISPKILLLLFETNSKEVSGFFSTYFFTPAMYKTIAMVCALLVLTIIGEIFRKRIAQIIAKPIATYIIIPVILLGAIGGCAALYRYSHLVLCRNFFGDVAFFNDCFNQCLVIRQGDERAVLFLEVFPGNVHLVGENGHHAFHFGTNLTQSIDCQEA